MSKKLHVIELEVDDKILQLKLKETRSAGRASERFMEDC